MKQFISIILFFLCSGISFAQQDSLVDIEPTGSYKDTLLKRIPSVNYSYIDSTQSHNYSGNWDFDFDGLTDSLYFVGNGGAHIYYNLKIVLSSDGMIRNFSYLLIDFPLLEEIEKLKEERFYPPPVFPQFVVHDFDDDGSVEIFINIDRMTFPVVLDELKKVGVSSRYILLDYKDNKIELRNFIN